MSFVSAVFLCATASYQSSIHSGPHKTPNPSLSGLGLSYSAVSDPFLYASFFVLLINVVGSCKAFLIKPQQSFNRLYTEKKIGNES